MTKQIIVVDQGWVLMGDTDWVDGAEQLTVKDAQVIRVWGTTRGLGEIALNGPTKDTILDPCGEAIVPKRAILFRLNCVF